MARVTVEDCIDIEPNRFNLIVMAAQRARQIANGADALIDEETDKPTVIALREIAEGLVNQDILNREEELEAEEELAEVMESTEPPM